MKLKIIGPNMPLGTFIYKLSWLFTLGIVLFATSSQSYAGHGTSFNRDLSADLSEEACPSLDFRERFGPAKNQGFHQICWAMTGASLIEEEACLMDSKYCGVSFSAVDMTSCDPRVGHSHEENVVERGLNCAQVRGICPNQLAPFVDFRMKQSLLGTLTMDKRFQRSQVFKIFDQYKVALRHKPYSEYLSQELQSIQHNFVKEFRRIFPANDFTDHQLVGILTKSKDTIELLDRTLVSNVCKENRVKFPGIGSVFTRIFPDLNPRILKYFNTDEIRKFSLPVSTQAEVIVERFKNGRSLALSICPEKFSFLEDLMIPGGDCVAGHAVVANAIRRNPETRACEVHLMDSRKEASTIQFDGWFNLEKLADATIAITQIIPRKN